MWNSVHSLQLLYLWLFYDVYLTCGSSSGLVFFCKYDSSLHIGFLIYFVPLKPAIFVLNTIYSRGGHFSQCKWPAYQLGLTNTCVLKKQNLQSMLLALLLSVLNDTSIELPFCWICFRCKEFFFRFPPLEFKRNTLAVIFRLVI